ncbi:MAG: GNAT superfamily N-acetyltransferase [Rhodothermales bacterium]|jgi:GNAT superfamily N-acetyltransferase
MPITIRKATPSDAELLVSLIRQLADYENMSDEVVADPVRLAEHLDASSSPRCEAIIAEDGHGEAAGFALYYWSYSTFLTDWGIYLEDLFVRDVFRGGGVGYALLAWLAGEVVRKGGRRLTWQVLDWNQPAIDFYSRLGARTAVEWETMRLEGAALGDLAGSLPAASARLAAYSRTDES